MGAPKQKWTSEEESALKSGVIKHGVGKWRTILKDPEYNSILFLRSNVDLKDKWRNMSVTANGWGSREKGRMALRRSHHHHHHHHHHNNISQSDEDMMSDTSEEVESDDDDDDIVDVKPLTAVSTGMLQIAAPPPPPPPTTPRQSLSRLETLIMEAITSLKEPSGSNKTSIAVYIEDQYNTPPNFKRILSAKVKGLASNGKLIKVNRKYRIAPSASSFSGVRRSSPAHAAVIAPPPPPPLSLPPPPVQAPAAAPVPTATVTATIRIEKEDMRNLMKSQIDAELAKMRNMSVQEAGAAAARAVAEAEAAMAEAEEAAREAEAAEADADAAQAFAEAAMTTLRSRYSNNLMVRG